MRIDTKEAGGVLLAQGARFGGHALYVKDGKLKYVYNWVGESNRSSSPPNGSRPATSSCHPRSSGRRDDADRGHTDATRQRQTDRRGTIKTQPGKFSLAGEGLNAGRDGGEPLTDDYPGESPWSFIGGEIERVIIDVSGEQFVDLAKEAAALFARE